jgi:hypothetical protein
MLEVNWDEKETSYIHNFVPFVAECVRTAAQPEISVPDCADCLRVRFGLNLPQYALNGIVRRGSRDGLFETRNGILYRNDQAVARFDLQPKREGFLREHEALLDKLREFAKSIPDLILTRQEAETALLNYLADRSLPILRSMLLGRHYQAPLLDTEGTDYLIASFISYLFERDPQGFDYLETIVKGTMLAAAIYLPDIGNRASRIRDLTVYFDTRLLLNALGLHGQTSQDAILELFILLQQLGARLSYFTHTLTELQNVVDNSVHQLRSSRRGRITPPGKGIYEYAVSAGLGPSELERRAEEAEGRLKYLGLTRRDTPKYTVDLGVDERRLEDLMQELVRYQREETRVYDVKSLTAIYRIRRGREMQHLEDAKAIFVTTNRPLVRASNEFFKETNDGRIVPIATQDWELGTVAWLKRPVSAPDLPRKQLLADCFAALEPGEQLWKKYVETIDRMEDDNSLDEESHAVLRYSVEARRALMDRTLGSADAFTMGSVKEILERAHENQQRELLSRLNEAESATAAERALRLEAQKEVADGQAALSAQEAAFNERRTSEAAARHVRISVLAARWSRWIGWILLGTLTVVVVAGLALTLPRPFPDLAGAVGRWFVYAIVLLLTGLTVLHMVKGWSATDISRSLEQRVNKWLVATISRHIEPEPTVSSGATGRTP